MVLIIVSITSKPSFEFLALFFPQIIKKIYYFNIVSAQNVLTLFFYCRY